MAAWLTISTGALQGVLHLDGPDCILLLFLQAIFELDIMHWDP